MTSPALQIGWSTKDLTPSRAVLLDGQFHVRVSESVHDPITVTALALADPRTGAQVVFVSADIVGVKPAVVRQVRDAVNAAGLDPANILLSATHTHTSMVLPEGKYPQPDGDVMTPTECTKHFVRVVAAAVTAAWECRAPGGFSQAYAQAVVGRNRRAAFLNGAARMYADTAVADFAGVEGYEDHGVHLLFTWDEQQELTGAIVNLACPSQETEHERFLSADFWHEARLEIRSVLGRDIPILAQCAPAGDQSPHLLFHQDIEQRMRDRRGISSRQEIARRLGHAAADGFDGAAAAIQWDARLQHHQEVLALPRRLVTEAERDQAEAEIKALQSDTAGDPGRHASFIRRNREVLKRYDQQQSQPNHEIELHVVRLGEVAFATNPFELFLDFGIRIKARSPAVQCFLTQITCGYDGYLPTRKAVEAVLHEQDRQRPGFSGNYGAGVASNRVGPAGGQILVNRTVEIMQELFAE